MPLLPELETLLQAIVDGNLSTVKTLLSQTPSLLASEFNASTFKEGNPVDNIRFPYWSTHRLLLTPVHFAFLVNRPDIARYLVQSQEYKHIKAKVGSIRQEEITPLRLLASFLFGNKSYFRAFNPPHSILPYSSSIFYLLLQEGNLEYFMNIASVKRNISLAEQIIPCVVLDTPDTPIFGWMYAALLLRKDIEPLGEEEEKLFNELRKVPVLPSKGELLEQLSFYNDVLDFRITISALNKALKTMDERAGREHIPVTKDEFIGLFGKSVIEVPLSDKAKQLQLNLFYHLKQLPVLRAPSDSFVSNNKDVELLLQQKEYEQFKTLKPLSDFLDPSCYDDTLEALINSGNGLPGVISVLEEISKLDDLSEIHRKYCQRLISDANRIVNSSKFQFKVALEDIYEELRKLSNIHQAIESELDNDKPSPLTELSDKLEKIQKGIQQTLEKFKALDNEAEQVSVRLASISKLEEMVKQLTRDVELKEKQLATIAAKNVEQADSINQFLQELQKLSQALQEQLKARQNEIEALKAENAELYKRLEQQDKKAEELDARHNATVTKLGRLATATGEIQTTLKGFEESETARLKQQVEELGRANKEYESEALNLRRDVARLIEAPRVNYNTAFFGKGSNKSPFKEKREYITGRFFWKNDPLTKTKDEILENFYQFSATHIGLKPKEMIDEWVKTYTSKFNKNPIDELKKNRSSWVTREVTNSINLLINYVAEYNKLHNEEDLPESLQEFIVSKA